MLVRRVYLFRVSVIVRALLDDVVLVRPRHSEVERLVLVVLVVIGVILMSVDVLRGHVVTARVLVMMRTALVVNRSHMVRFNRVMGLLRVMDRDLVVRCNRVVCLLRVMDRDLVVRCNSVMGLLRVMDRDLVVRCNSVMGLLRVMDR